MHWPLIPTLSWIFIVAYWSFRSVGNKKTERIPFSASQTIISLLLPVGFLLLFSGRNGIWFLQTEFIPATNTFGVIGSFLCLLGVYVAVWARRTIGNNWSGAIITLKEDHKLVTQGPYKRIRHPIYTGFLLITLGTALISGSSSVFLGAACILLGFAMRIPREEALMHAQFPNEYQEYKKRTGALIPRLHP